MMSDIAHFVSIMFVETALVKEEGMLVCMINMIKKYPGICSVKVIILFNVIRHLHVDYDTPNHRRITRFN